MKIFLSNDPLQYGKSCIYPVLVKQINNKETSEERGASETSPLLSVFQAFSSKISTN